jgi:hypothetical protein
LQVQLEEEVKVNEESEDDNQHNKDVIHDRHCMCLVYIVASDYPNLFAYRFNASLNLLLSPSIVADVKVLDHSAGVSDDKDIR